MNPNVNQINYGWNKKKNFTITLCKNVFYAKVLMYSTDKEGKSVVAERFIRTLKDDGTK